VALVQIKVDPGVDREGTSYAAKGRWFECDKVRFVSGNPEKIGGWQRISRATYKGVCRSLVNWTTLAGDQYIGVGTNLKYYLERGGSYFDITPIRQTSENLDNPFSTYVSTLKDSIEKGDSIIEVSSGNFPESGGIIKIGSEIIRYDYFKESTFFEVTRGYNGTEASDHAAGADIYCSTISVQDVGNGTLKNDFVTISGAEGFNGLSTNDLNKEHQVFNATSSDSFSIDLGVFPTASGSGGGSAVKVQYQINTGLDIYKIGVGWGTDPWGEGGYGSPGKTGLGQQLRLWSAANYGEDLVFSPRKGEIFYWQASRGATERAEYLKDLSSEYGYKGQFVPHTTNKVITTPTERFVVALGANPYDPTQPNSNFDPLLVRWSDQENPYDWVPEITNQAGGFRLSHGSYIVGSVSTRQETLIWTDQSLYSMQYVGAEYVWGFNQITDNISVMSPQSIATANNVVFWMGKDKFYLYNGRVQVLPCTLRQYIFSDINKDQSYQVFSGTNESYSEVWWFYCSNQSSTVDKYVVYNYLENIWYYGSLKRSAWLDSTVRLYPLAATYDNTLVDHEFGTDDNETDETKPIHAYIQSADVEIGEGNDLLFVWRILPDVNFTGSESDKPSVTVTLRPRRNAGAAFRQADSPTVQSKDDYRKQPMYIVQQFNGQIYTRLRARQMALRVESNEIGIAWELGSFRADVVADGTR